MVVELIMRCAFRGDQLPHISLKLLLVRSHLLASLKPPISRKREINDLLANHSHCEAVRAASERQAGGCSVGTGSECLAGADLPRTGHKVEN